MKKEKKKFSFIRFIFKAILWLVILLLILLGVGYYYLGSIVKEAINRYVPEVTGTTAIVEHVDLSLLKGHVEIRGLKIGNPKGYSTNNIFELGKIEVVFLPKSVLSDKIIVNSVLIDGTKVSAELKNLYSLDNNVSALQKNVENYLGVSNKKETPKKENQTPKQTQKSAGKKVIVKDLKINNTEVSVGFSGHTVSIPLPNIHKTGIGEEKKEKTVGEIVADILDLISVESLKGIAIGAKDIAIDIATGTKDLAKKGLKDAKEIISSGSSSVKENAQNALKGIKGLFK